MFVDILGRIQQWTNLVQAKLDLCKAVIEALRKELMARACEIANLRKLLAECEEREVSLSFEAILKKNASNEFLTKMIILETSYIYSNKSITPRNPSTTENDCSQ